MDVKDDYCKELEKLGFFNTKDIEEIEYFAVLATGLKNKDEFADLDDFGPLGKNMRMDAMIKIFNPNIKKIFLIGGYSEEFEISKPSVMKKYLTKENKVIGDYLEEIECTDANTLGNVLSLIELLKKYGRIGIITSKYHAPRVRELLEYFKQDNFILIPAESFITSNLHNLEKRFENEIKGIEDILSGKYNNLSKG